MTSEELKKTYSALSTKELLQIIDNKFDYTELAVSIAIAELSTRQVSEEDIRQYKKEQVEKAVNFIKRNISDDLTLWQKNFFYFLWFPLINFPFKQNFRDDSRILKLKQANYYSVAGFALFLLTEFVSGMFNLSSLISLAVWIICFVPVYAFDETFNRQNQIRRLQKLYANREPAAEPKTADEQNGLQ